MSRSPGIAAIQQSCIKPGWARGVPADFAAGHRDGWRTVVTAELSLAGWQWMVSQWQAGPAGEVGPVRVCDWGCCEHAEFQALCDRLYREASALVGWVCDDAHAGRVELPGCRVIDQEGWVDVWAKVRGQLACKMGLWSGLAVVMARWRLGLVHLPADAGHAPAGWLTQLAIEDLGESEEGLVRRRIVPGCTTEFTRNLARAWVLWRDGVARAARPRVGEGG